MKVRLTSIEDMEYKLALRIITILKTEGYNVYIEDGNLYGE